MFGKMLFEGQSHACLRVSQMSNSMAEQQGGIINGTGSLTHNLVGRGYGFLPLNIISVPTPAGLRTFLTRPCLRIIHIA